MKIPVTVASLVLLSIAGFGQKPRASPTPVPPPPAVILTKVDSISETVASKKYYERKDEGFRIELPSTPFEYVPPKLASPTAEADGGRVAWQLAEADIVIMFGDMDPRVADLAPEKKLQILAVSIEPEATEEGTTNVSKHDITIAGLPAKEITYERGGHKFILRDVFVGTRLFVLAAGLHAVDNAEALVVQALNTFEPIGK